jgi:predicted transcriptional regulator
MYEKSMHEKTDAKNESFVPSMKILSRILNSLANCGYEGKTSLSLDTNLNYSRLKKYVSWMERKGLVESSIENGKIMLSLTKNGMEFTKTFVKEQTN